MKCKNCGRALRYGIWNLEHADDGWITCVTNTKAPFTSAEIDEEKEADRNA